MSLKSAVKETVKGHNGPGIALWAALGFALVAPLLVSAWMWIKNKAKPVSTAGQG